MMPSADNVPECGAFLDDRGRCLWRVWAPNAKRVELVLGSRRHAMTPKERGHFEWQRDDVVEGLRYAYSLDGGPPRPDPASLWQPDSVHAASAVFNPCAFDWSNHAWHGVPSDKLVLYEIHVGTFTPEGTFAAIVPRLPQLVELGVTAIELMPVNQFPGSRDWGYDGVHWRAVQNTYGGPRELQKLVDACHLAGLAVILDVVFNHLGPEGNYLPEFGPYLSTRFRTPWGEGINFDDGGSDPVRELVLSCVRQWVRDFQFDGLRLDAVHAIHDASPRHILADIKQAADEAAAARGWPVHVIAESDLNDVRLLQAPTEGGYGLDAQWCDDFHHCVHCLLTGESSGYYADYPQPAEQLVKVLNQSFAYDGCYSKFRDRRHGAPAGAIGGERIVIAAQTHDQVGNRARGERLHQLVSAPQRRLAAGLLLLAPHTPLLFMGEEYGELHAFAFFCDFQDERLRDAVRLGREEEFAAFHWTGPVFDALDPETFERSKLSWSWADDVRQAGLRQLYKELFAARRVWPPLAEFRFRRAELLDGGRLLRFMRGDPQSPQHILVALFNLTGETLPLPHEASRLNLLLRSEETRFGGDGSGGEQLSPFEFAAFGGPWGTAQ